MRNSPTDSEKISNLFGNFPSSVSNTKQPTLPPTQKQIKEKYNIYRVLIKSLNNCSQRFNKIGNSYLDIKNHIKIVFTDLEGIQSTLKKMSSMDKKQFSQNLNLEANILIINSLEQSHQKIASIYADHATYINNFIEMYSTTIKKKYTRFTQEVQSLDHYKQKVNSLVGTSEYNKFERNKNKLTSAQRDYQEIACGIDKDLKKINEEGYRILLRDYTQSLTNLLKEYDTVKLRIQTSDILQKKKNKIDDFFNLDAEDQIIVSDEDNEYDVYESIQEILVINRRPVKIKQDKLSLYFKDLSFGNKNGINIMDTFGLSSSVRHQKVKNISQNKTEKPTKHPHFRKFANIFASKHHKPKKHAQLNQVRDSKECQSALISSKIKIKEIKNYEKNQISQYQTNQSKNKPKTEFNKKYQSNITNHPQNNYSNYATQHKNSQKKDSVDLLDLEL